MIKAIVTDIEGTTSSLSFVKDVLFPYARERIDAYVRQNANVAKVKQQLDEVRKIAGNSLDLEAIATLLCQWIDEDQKITPLKTLQGYIWQAGYEAGDFTGHVYQDAAQCLREWNNQGIKLYVFSSGSVKAQKLIFSYSDFGDLTSLFSGYFDTQIGTKRDPEAYRHIVAETGFAADEVLFLSDIVEELQAADVAGMKICQLVREGQAAWHGCSQVNSFDQIDLTEF